MRSNAQLGGERHAALEHERRGDGTITRGRSSYPTREVFEAYLQEALVPALRAGQIVVMDNLSSHKGPPRVREFIEAAGCELCCTCRPTRRTSTP